MELDAEQRAAVEVGGGPVLVVAGAGTGKTRTLTWRVAHLLDRGVEPHRIALLTFTNRAARHMIAAVRALGYDAARYVIGGTFHSVAHSFLTMYTDKIGFPRGFRVMDAEEASARFGEVAREEGFQGGVGQLERLAELCSRCVNTAQGVEAVLAARSPELLPWSERVRALFEAWAAYKRAADVMDFDDLLLYLRAALELPELASGLGSRFEHVLVDEYQDTNALQRAIVQRLAAVHGNVMAVGDDAQAIYGFRGADVGNLLAFREHFPGARMLQLTQNYRSSTQILEIANRVIRRNATRIDKTLVSVQGEGPAVVVAVCRDPEEEAAFVASRVSDYLAGGVAPREMAVLYRTHRQSAALQRALERVGARFATRSSLSLLGAPGVRRAVDLLHVASRPADELAWARVLVGVAGVGARSASRAAAVIAAAPSPQEGVRELRALKHLPVAAHPAIFTLGASLGGWAQAPPAASLREAGALATALAPEHAVAPGALGGLVEIASSYEALDEFLADVVLGGGMTRSDEEAVALSTIHQAKGLEWPLVFVTGLAEGALPLAREGEVEDIEEERRLFFVAVTRAARRLYLCAPGAVQEPSGRRVASRLSRFLEEAGVWAQEGEAGGDVEVWRVALQ